MKRLHLFELEDLRWFPPFLRNYGTDYLRFIANQFDIYKGIVPLLRKAIRRSEAHHIIDLASGAGGGWIRLYDHLKEDFPELRVTLTDYYPNIPAFREILRKGGQAFNYEAESVDARNVPPELTGLRTQFLSLHHFRPADATRIIQNAVDARQPLAVFEVTERRLVNLIPIILSPLTVIAFTPFIRPFSIWRILFTYIVPIVPLFVLWDGLVSVARSYSVKELRELVAQAKGWQSFEWEIGRFKDGPSVVIYLVGWPNEAVCEKGEGERA